MKFIPSEQYKNYKIFDETGFCRSTVDNITEYFLAYDQMLRQSSLNDIERDVWIYAMYYDFMSYVAQRLWSYHEHGKSLQGGRVLITSVITEYPYISLYMICRRIPLHLTEFKEIFRNIIDCWFIKSCLIVYFVILITLIWNKFHDRIFLILIWSDSKLRTLNGYTTIALKVTSFNL